VSGPGKEDKPGKDYWKTGDPNLRAKVISSVGLALIITTVAVGATSFDVREAMPSSTEERENEDREAPPLSPPQLYSPPAPTSALASRSISLMPLLFIVGIVLVIVGIVLYLRRRKKAFP
jgi:hypothetical protein